MKRILPLLAAVVVTIALITVPASAATFDWQGLADDPVNYGSYELYHLRCVSPTFSCLGFPSDIPTSYNCVFAPWGSFTVDGKAKPTNFLTGLLIGSSIQVTIPSVAGIWNISYTVDGGNTWKTDQQTTDGTHSSYFSFDVPYKATVAYILTGIDLEKPVYMADFETYVNKSKGISWEDREEISQALKDNEIGMPGLDPIQKLLNSVTFDPAAATAFSAIWAVILPENGALYPIIGAVIAIGVLGFVLFGKKG